MSELVPFRLNLGANGYGTVVVGDVDLSGVVSSIALDARAGKEVTRLVVELLGDVDVEGLGEVTVVRAAGRIVDFLEEIDPEKLEKEALGRLSGFDDASTIDVVLDVLTERAKRWGG